MFFLFFSQLISFDLQFLAIHSRANEMIKDSENNQQIILDSCNNSLFYQLDSDKLIITGTIASYNNSSIRNTYND